MNKKVRIGLIGSGFISDIHAASIKNFVQDAEIVAVASIEGVTEFARQRSIPHAFEDYRDLLAMKEIDMVTLGVPNYLHCELTLAAARAGKHVVCEKPLCRTLEEAGQMIETCREKGVLLLYAEELLFAPKYVRARALVQEGAVGSPFLVRHSEEHSGPHMPWFWDVNLSGGGVLMDMGCHSIEVARWILGKPDVKSVTALMGTFVHAARTRGEDHSICVVEYEGDRLGIAENSWAKGGGVDDRCEILGSKGNTRADLIRGSSLLTYSDAGYAYAGEKAATTQGWSFATFEESWNFGFPQEMQHFVNCALGREDPVETGEDGRTVLEIMYAAYQSAGEGRKMAWPYSPPRVDKPIDLWKPAGEAAGHRRNTPG